MRVLGFNAVHGTRPSRSSASEPPEPAIRAVDALAIGPDLARRQ
jgi:hypothetical protein